MAKKNFSGGLDSLLGGSTDAPKKETKPVIPKKEKKVKEVQKDWWENLSADQLALLKKLASKENKSVEDVVSQAIDFYLEFQPEIKYGKE